MKSILSHEPIYGVEHNIGPGFKNAFYINYDALDGSLMKTMSLHYIHPEMYTHKDEFDPPKLNTPEGQGWFKKISSRYEIIVIDTLSNSHTGDENSEKDMKNVLRFLKQQAGNNNLIIVLHHTAKLTGDVRGSGAIKANADTILKFYEYQRRNVFRIVYAKCRGADKNTVYQYSISDKDGGTWVTPLSSTTKNDLYTEKEEHIKTLIIDAITKGTTTVTSLAKKLKKSKKNISNTVNTLVQSGILAKIGSGSMSRLTIAP
jgi:hypothetical protein